MLSSLIASREERRIRLTEEVNNLLAKIEAKKKDILKVDEELNALYCANRIIEQKTNPAPIPTKTIQPVSEPSPKAPIKN